MNVPTTVVNAMSSAPVRCLADRVMGACGGLGARKPWLSYLLQRDELHADGSRFDRGAPPRAAAIRGFDPRRPPRPRGAPERARSHCLALGVTARPLHSDLLRQGYRGHFD